MGLAAYLCIFHDNKQHKANISLTKKNKSSVILSWFIYVDKSYTELSVVKRPNVWIMIDMHRSLAVTMH